MEEKKIPIFRSLSAKMFYYMAALIISVISVISFQNHNAFSNFLSEHASSELVASAEAAISQVETQIENWKAHAGTVVPTYSGDKNVYGEALSRLVDSNTDFIAVQVFNGTKDGENLELIGNSRTKKIDDVRFEDKVGASVVAQSLSESKRILAKKLKALRASKNTTVHSLAVKTKLPIMFVVSQYDIPASTEILWSILIVWQSSLVKSLPKTTFLDSALIDVKGDIFSSNNLLSMTTKNKFSGDSLTAAATSSRKLSGTVNEYQSNRGKSVVAGYARSPLFGLAVVVEEDFSRAYAEMDANRNRTMLWSTLFLLIAAMLAYACSSGTIKDLLEVRNAIRRLSKGNFEDNVTINSNDEIAALAADINKMGSNLPAFIKAETTRTISEIDKATTKMVQASFFSKKNVLAKNLRVSGFYQPSTKCGGDLWGHYELQDDIHLLFVADAMGVGVPAALVTAVTYSVGATISCLAAEKSMQSIRPSDLLRHVNTIIWNAFEGSMSLTMFCAVIDTKDGKMTYANAGHNFPFIIPVQANDTRGSKKNRSKKENMPQPFSLKLMGNPLGMQKNCIFAEKEMTVEPGDKIFLFSDGLIECSSPLGEVWGRKHLFCQLSEITTLPFDELKDEILSRAFSFFANKPLEDDVTVVVAEIPKVWKSQKATEKLSRRPDIRLPLPVESAACAPMSAPLPMPPPSAFPKPEKMSGATANFSEASEIMTRDVVPTFSISELTAPSTPSEIIKIEILEYELEFLKNDLDMESRVVNHKTQSEGVFSDENAIDMDLELPHSAQEIVTAANDEAFTQQATLVGETAHSKRPKRKYKIQLTKTG